MNSPQRDVEGPGTGEEPASGAARLIPNGLDAILVLLRHGQTQFIVEKRFQGAMEAPLTALGETQARGQGVGAGVEYIVLQHVFGSLGLNKLCCEVFADNEAVWKLHQSFGFTREALLREHVFKDGAFRDVVGLGILARDWAAARPACEARLREKGRDPASLRIVEG